MVENNHLLEGVVDTEEIDIEITAKQHHSPIPFELLGRFVLYQPYQKAVEYHARNECDQRVDLVRKVRARRHIGSHSSKLN